MSAISDMTAMLMQEASRLMEMSDPEEIKSEVARSKALTEISGVMLEQSRLYLDAVEVMDKARDAHAKQAAMHMLGAGNGR